MNVNLWPCLKRKERGENKIFEDVRMANHVRNENVTELCDCEDKPWS